jgi:hypothetical protein
MAKYDISLIGSELVLERVVTLGDFAESTISFESPTIELVLDKIKFYERGIYKTALRFEDINEIDGVAPTDIEDAKDKTLTIIGSLGSSYTPPYKVFKGLITQSGTNAPSVITVADELSGGIVWGYVAPGIFNGTLVGAFPLDKTITILMKGVEEEGVGVTLEVQRINDNIVQIITKLSLNGVPTNSLIAKASLIIEVYN